MAPASYESDPDALRAHFAIELRRLRTRAGLSMNQLAQALGCTPQWIYQMEQVDKAVPEQTALDVDTYFKTEGWEESDGLFVRIYRAIQRAGQRRLVRPNYEAYVKFEAEAIGIRCFAVQLVPGLLQTENYMRGLMDPSDQQETKDARVAERLGRQAILAREKPPSAMFVLDELVLHRPIGGPKIMVEQIEHLIKMTETSDVQIRILPAERVTSAALNGSFILLNFSRGQDLMYIESGTVSRLVDDRDTVFRAEVRFITIMGEALPQAETIERLHRMREELL